jgi:hypothetical protein
MKNRDHQCRRAPLIRHRDAGHSVRRGWHLRGSNPRNSLYTEQQTSLSEQHFQIARQFLPPHDAVGITAISRWLSEATPPDRHASESRIPEGCQQDRASVQIPVFVFHTRRFQELCQLLTKRLSVMMLGLVRDVFLHPRSCGGTHRESAVTFLPGEFPQADLFMHPDGGCLLQLPHKIRQAMRGLQSHQQMHMIGDTAYPLRESTESAHRAAKVVVQSFPPGIINQRDPIFGGEHNVLVQSEKRRGHKNAGLLASLRDAGCLLILSGGVASLNHRLMALMPSASLPTPC